MLPHKAHLMNQKVGINFLIYAISTSLSQQRSYFLSSRQCVSKNQSEFGMPDYLAELKTLKMQLSLGTVKYIGMLVNLSHH